uniref:transposase n=1 Tax=Candidatus Enterovibrio escicola TaxID=1927127 RepID=UPI0037442765
MSVKVTTVNVDDRKLVPEMADELWGCLHGDKGYLYKLVPKIIGYIRHRFSGINIGCCYLYRNDTTLVVDE